MIDALLADLIDQLTEPFDSERFLDSYLDRCCSAIRESEAFLVESLFEQKWLQQVLHGGYQPTYSTLFEKYRCLDFFERLTNADKEALLNSHFAATDAAQRILREQRDAVQVLSLLRDCLTTFGSITDPHPPVAHFVQTARSLLDQHEQLKHQLALLTEFNKPVNIAELQSVAKMIDQEIASAADNIINCENSMIDFLHVLETRITRSLAGESNTSLTISESALIRLISTMDLIQELQIQQEEEALVWQARSKVAEKKSHPDLAERALQRSKCHEQRAAMHHKCLKAVEGCVQKVRDVPLV